MILGDRSELAFEVHSISPDWKRNSVDDLGPWCRLSVCARGAELTNAVDPDSGEFLRGVNVPLVPICEWLVSNYKAVAFEASPRRLRTGFVSPHRVLALWNASPPLPGVSDATWEDERFAWYERHFWLAGARGAVLPDLGFARSDDRLWISRSRYVPAGERRLEFLRPDGVSVVAWEPARAAIEALVRFVVDELDARGVRSPLLSGADDPVRAARLCSADEFLRYAAPEFESSAAELAGAHFDDPESSAAVLAARDCDGSSAARRGALVRELAQWANAVDTAPECAALDAARDEIRSAVSTKPSIDAGYDAARWVRARAGLDGEPLGDGRLQALCDEFADVVSVPAVDPAHQTLVGRRAHLRGRVTSFAVAGGSEPAWSRRMERARALGHLLLDAESGDGVVGAASSDVAVGPRRRRSGAFAAELLLPESGVRRFLNGRDASADEVFASVMREFGVGARTAAYHLWNRNLFASEEVRDRLIEAHGRAPL